MGWVGWGIVSFGEAEARGGRGAGLGRGGRRGAGGAARARGFAPPCRRDARGRDPAARGGRASRGGIKRPRRGAREAPKPYDPIPNDAGRWRKAGRGREGRDALCVVVSTFADTGDAFANFVLSFANWRVT